LVGVIGQLPTEALLQLLHAAEAALAMRADTQPDRQVLQGEEAHKPAGWEEMTVDTAPGRGCRVTVVFPNNTIHPLIQRRDPGSVSNDPGNSRSAAL